MGHSCLIVAGEKSGEEHCLTFLSSLQEHNRNCSFWGVGGDSMSARGVELLYHLRDFSTWGFDDVLFKFNFYLKALRKIRKEVVKRGTKVAILIDFQEFNMILAGKLQKSGVKVLYYVAPQVWAWRSKRVKRLRRSVDTLFTLLPFENEWFTTRGLKRVVSVPHPLWQEYGSRLDSTRLGIVAKPFSHLSNSLRLLLLPGSRNDEVSSLLPVFIRAVRELRSHLPAHSTLEISLVRSKSVAVELYSPYMSEIDVCYDSSQLEDALISAHLALAANGTVTLAAALFEVPTVATYKVSLFTHFIFETFIRYRGLTSLANIVHQEMIFPELLQNEVTSFNIVAKLIKWIENRDVYEDVKNRLSHTAQMLKGDDSSCSSIMSSAISEAYNE